jgi:hypothetical protein
MHFKSPLPIVVTLLLFTAGCQTPPAATKGDAEAANVQTTSEGLGGVPDCASGGSATLADGVRVGYLGSDPTDPQRCLLEWSDRSHPLYFGFWSPNPKRPISEQARRAFLAALTGPVGTEALFRDDDARMWNDVTVTHTANHAVDVAGHLRPALELRVVRHDALGRSDVRAETHYTIDRATGVLLRSESVTPMADGGVRRTTGWQLDTLGQAG